MSSLPNNTTPALKSQAGSTSSHDDGWNLRRVVIVIALIGSLVGAITTVLLGPQGLPFVATEFNTEQGVWFVTIELLAAAVLTPLVARMAELYGKRRIILALMVFGIIGSVLVAIAPVYWVMLAGRFFQGATIACSALAPAIVREALPERIAPLGVGLVATGSGLPGALIPFITGPVIDHYGFRVVFWGMAAMMALFAVLILATISESKIIDSGSVDYVGALLLGGGVAAVLAGMSFGPTLGWTSFGTLTLFVLGVVAVAVWVKYSLVSQNPLIDLSFLADRRMSAGMAAGGLIAGTGTLFLIASSYVAQTPADASLGYGLGLDASSYAYLQTFYFLGFLVGGIIAVQALRRMSFISVVLGGATLLALGAIIGVLSIHQVVVFGAVHLLVGTVIGVFFSANFNFIFESVVATRRSSASSLYLTATTLSQSLYSILPLSLAAVFFPAVIVGALNLESIRFLFFFILGTAVVAAALAVTARKVGKS
ncbi:MFS transporter [Rhodococcus globerulus]|uniref:MFS transporter n=1 Tax=Rhodococcus globerulus TaxID=33008 RepID=A0ABU4C4X9_RHOGO|nr:MFS transporter [Rhodococcus globerulus]MDV6271413.1 MFS transporter [Rhodococcus globerulus]